MQHCLARSGTLEELFDEFAERPVASGSIAQIHKARLSEEGARGSEYPQGTVVAVKVLPAEPCPLPTWPPSTTACCYQACVVHVLIDMSCAHLHPYMEVGRYLGDAHW